jgi:hypothetical protein
MTVQSGERYESIVVERTRLMKRADVVARLPVIVHPTIDCQEIDWDSGLYLDSECSTSHGQSLHVSVVDSSNTLNSATGTQPLISRARQALESSCRESRNPNDLRHVYAREAYLVSSEFVNILGTSGTYRNPPAAVPSQQE